MTRTAVLFAASLILASCATRPRLCTPLKAEPPVRGSIVQPVTAEEAAATRDYLSSAAEARAWGRVGWTRAGVAAEGCDPPAEGPPWPG